MPKNSTEHGSCVRFTKDLASSPHLGFVMEDKLLFSNHGVPSIVVEPTFPTFSLVNEPTGPRFLISISNLRIIIYILIF